MATRLDTGFVYLTANGLDGWRMAGKGGFRHVDGALESAGGPGILWYAPLTAGDFILRGAWRTASNEDSSGIFLRIPALADDIAPAIEQGFEVQIDDRGCDYKNKRTGSALHATGAIYGLCPARRAASKPVGEWNEFEITAYSRTITVRLNGAEICRYDFAMRRSVGHIGLQSHHEGSRVQFHDLRLQVLSRRS